jgi:hypothetical protein
MMKCSVPKILYFMSILLVLTLFTSNSAFASELQSKYRRPVPSTAHHKDAAQEEGHAPAEKQEGAKAQKEKPPTLEAGLEKKYRYSQKFQSEIGIYGGDFLGDEWYNTWDAGARYYFNINDMLAFGAEYFYSPIRADSSGDFGKSLTTKHTHSLFAAMMLSNPGTFKAGSIIECDLYLTVGGGSMQINHGWQPMAVVGGGIKVYTPAPWFAVRFDVNSFMHPTPKPGGNAFNADLSMNAGVSFLFPVKRVEEEATEETENKDPES